MVAACQVLQETYTPCSTCDAQHPCVTSLPGSHTDCLPTSVPGAVSQTQVCVQGIPWKYTWKELKELLAECGEVERADVMTAPDGRSKVRLQQLQLQH